jgi:hypothetical protein
LFCLLSSHPSYLSSLFHSLHHEIPLVTHLDCWCDRIGSTLCFFPRTETTLSSYFGARKSSRNISGKYQETT